ncbi:MAG: 3-phosphoshikimate 1-carboxyvinyltransferase [Clostridia bacterium]|nr:3-phosphoshikimate 1-carboxyvinyltransferase [Clostridia bacterium]
MDMRILPSRLRGKVRVIGSKSDAHRLLICAALADGETRLRNIPRSADVEATVSCLRAMGAKIAFSGGAFTVRPITEPAENPKLNCRESGTTFRFLLPVAAAVCGRAEFSGEGRLPDRPIGELASALENHGVAFSGKKLPFGISGKLECGEYVLPGNVSSQYVSGLLIALSRLTGESCIRLTSHLESSPYVDMTLSSLRRFGVKITAEENGYIISGGRICSPGMAEVAGDWSNAAFFLASGALGAKVSVSGLDTASPQGDKAFLDILRRFGAEVIISGDTVAVKSGDLRGCDADISATPDLLPILAVVAAFAEGESRFSGAARLRLKESDRLKTVSAMINALGGKAEELPDGLAIWGKPLVGGRVDGAGDHRIVMAAAVAAACGGGAEIAGAEAVGKSYPGFFEEYSRLGGKASVV